MTDQAALELELSEGATDALDVLKTNIQHWIGDLGELQRQALRTARLSRGTSSEAEALAFMGALNNVAPFSRTLTTARTRAQKAADQAASEASSAMLHRINEHEPISTIGD